MTIKEISEKLNQSEESLKKLINEDEIENLTLSEIAILILARESQLLEEY